MRREGLYVRGTVFEGLPDYVKALGGDALTLARAAGLDNGPRHRKDNFYSWGAICKFFELAALELNEPYFGLKWAVELPDDFRSSGPNILLAMTVKDIREFLDLAIEYQKIHTNGLAYSYAENKDATEVIGALRFHPLSPPCRQYSEHIIAVIAQMGRRHLQDFPLRKVRFQHRAPDDLTWYEKAIGCPVEFNADRTEVIVDATLLDIPLGGKFAIGRPLLRGYLNHRLAKKGRHNQSIALMVSEILPSMLGVHKSDLESIAGFMEMNSKKLQRLLKDEGTSFSKILDETRQSIAARLLQDSDISISRMAAMLDYKSTEAFTTAAKRWFGKTPSKYRSMMRQANR